MRTLLFMLCLVAARSVFPQGDMITVTGEQLIGREDNGELVREVTGNVVLTQGNVVITCNRAIQYIARNNARLIGNVVVRQDTLTITTPEGWYYGNERRAFSDKTVKLNDKKVILTALIGEYLFNDSRAKFRGTVRLYDTVSTMTADRLDYLRRENRAFAWGNVSINDRKAVIIADSLEHTRGEQITFAYSNVSIRNLADNSVIYGNRLADYRKTGYSRVDRQPLLLQADTARAGEKDTVQSVDTLIIASGVMEAWRDTAERFIASDSVRIWRGEFAGTNDRAVYLKQEERIVINRVSDSSRVPVLWYQQNQLSGDSIDIRLNGKSVTSVRVVNNAMLGSRHEEIPDRYDQISGRQVQLFFNDNQLSHTSVRTDVLSMYFLFEDGEANGLMKSSAQGADIFFENRKVKTVKLLGDPVSEYHPENVINGRLREYTLPKFTVYSGRPVKQGLLSGRVLR